LEGLIARQSSEREEMRVYEAFLEEYRDPDLSEGHRKSLEISKLEPGLRDFEGLQEALEYLVEGGHALDGLSVREVVDRARVLNGVEVEIPSERNEFVFAETD
jgi:hypothetical protein